ncbi:hypothetical protein [Paraglaciecola sp.]|uniref:hypothetical protein n=1 Tax=Paraglaciecola sp. TaxID=1920173 RepID=UPI0030F3C028
MRIYILFYVLIFFVGCAQHSYEIDILESEFGEEYGGGEILFVNGPWYAPGSNFGYEISESDIQVASTNNDNVAISYVIARSSCPEIELEIQNLMDSVYESINVGLGHSSIQEPEIEVMDGYTYKLTLSLDKMRGRITLIGGENSRLAVPWVNSAKKLGKVITTCKIS